MNKIFKGISLIVIWLAFSSYVWGQDKEVEKITDSNFKQYISKGVVVVKFTAKWSDKNSAYDEDVLGKIKGHEGARIVTVASEDTKKVCKKLRLRNFPSIVLFHDGSKKDTWKADMDGILEVTDTDIKSSIDDVLAGDVF